MNLQDAFDFIALKGNMSGSDTAILASYAYEDTVGGRDTGQWSNMSVYEDEGKVLYSLIRFFRPETVVEIGVDKGGTSSHILEALKKNNKGYLYSYDINPDCGSDVRPDLRDRWRLVCGSDALLAAYPPNIGIAFEDGPHDYGFTLRMLTKLRDMNPRLILTHDMYAHQFFNTGFEVMRAFKDVFDTEDGLLINNSNTGLGFWWNPKYTG